VSITDVTLRRALGRIAATITALTIVLACGAGGAAAQDLGPAPTDRVGAGVPPAGAIPELLQDVGLDQRLNTQLPLSLQFRDETGRTVRLGEYFGKRPVILTLAYYECPMLCTQVLNGVASAIGVLKFSVGQEYDIVTVSFDPRDTPERARAKKAAYIQRYGRPGADRGWHFLTGNSREISALTRAVGFRYAYNASLGQFAHASGIMVATPEGRLSHYFYGIEYWPRDLRLALIEAADHTIGGPVDQVVLYCFHYDPASGKYSLAVMTVVRIAGVLTLVAGVTAIVWMRRHERPQTVPRSAQV
jgi:protein SCO1/2